MARIPWCSAGRAGRGRTGGDGGRLDAGGAARMGERRRCMRASPGPRHGVPADHARVSREPAATQVRRQRIARSRTAGMGERGTVPRAAHELRLRLDQLDARKAASLADVKDRQAAVARQRATTKAAFDHVLQRVEARKHDAAQLLRDLECSERQAESFGIDHGVRAPREPPDERRKADH
jgi:hypothetical protein